MDECYIILYERNGAAVVRNVRETYTTFHAAQCVIERDARKWPGATWRILELVAEAKPAALLDWHFAKEVL